MDELEETMAQYGLPELPEEYDGRGACQLLLFRMHDSTVPLGELVSLADAQEYCSREDTHGSGWFVGYSRTAEADEPDSDGWYEPDSEYKGDGQVLIAGVLYDEATGEESEPQDDDAEWQRQQHLATDSYKED